MTQKNLTSNSAATIVANEDGSPIPLVISATQLTVKNGNTGTFTVALPCKPTVNTVVKTTVVDAGWGLTVTGGASLTFTNINWATPQTVTLTAGAGQAGVNRVVVAPFGADVPGYESVTVHALVS